MIRYIVVRALLILTLVESAAFAQQPSPLAGRPLADVLAELQAGGLRIVYSTAIVRSSMKVTAEPSSDDPRTVLDEILAPHDLRAEAGPGGTIIILDTKPRQTGPPTGRIEGIAIIADQAPLATTIEITIDDTGFGVATGPDGTFHFPKVPEGTYILTAKAEGFALQKIEDVQVEEGSSARVRFVLVPLSVFLSEVIVTPSHFRLLLEQPENRQFLNREEVAQMPHAANDLYRAVKRLPGGAGGDYSANFSVRGGVQDEMLVILDGLELYEPFHLKDFQNVFSTIDSEAVGGVDFLTGGFPAEYGDRMSGVMDISIATPSGPTTTAIEVGTLNSRIMSQGSFDQGEGGWFVSARAWYPAAVAGLVTGSENQVITDYYDLIAKLQHTIGVRSTLSANFLVAFDDLAYGEQDAEEIQEVTAEYGSYAAWLNLQTLWRPELWSQTVLSASRLRRQRMGGLDELNQGVLAVDDHRNFNAFNLGQDWAFDLSDRQILKWGFDLTHSDAEYRYFNLSTFDPGSEVFVLLEPEGDAFAAYASDRLRLTDHMVIELGLRWDRQTWIDEGHFSPRFNLAYQPGPRTTLRAAWGQFRQSQRLNELQIEDGVEEFYPAQLSEHWLVSAEHGFSRALGVRLELYYKDIVEIRPRYENLFDPIVLFPEVEPDRILVDPDRGRARGFEIVFKGSSGAATTWWASYSLSNAEDLIDDRWQPRSWDQQHAATAGLNLALNHGWNLNIAGTYHSGWPTTALTAEFVEDPDGEPEIQPILGPRNAERLPSYYRFDARASKFFPSNSGDFTLVLEVLNLTNRRNVCCIEDFEYIVSDDGTVTVLPQNRYWAPIIPSVSLRWQF